MVTRKYRLLKKNPNQCAGCGLCFGSNHIAVRIEYREELQGDVCQWCYSDIQVQGIKRFMKRQAYDVANALKELT